MLKPGMSELSPRATKMLTRWKGPADPTLAAPALKILLAEKNVPNLGAFLDFESRYSGRRYAPFGDTAERRLGIAQYWREGDKRPQVHVQKTEAGPWIAQCLRLGSKPERPVCLHEDSRLCDAGLKLPAIGEPHPFANSIEQFLEWDAVVDEIEVLDGSWHTVRAQGPDGLARSLAEKFSIAPVSLATGIDLAAWADTRVRVRFSKTHRLFEPRPIVVEVYAASRALADEIAHAMGDLIGRAPAVAPWPAPGFARVERVRP